MTHGRGRVPVKGEVGTPTRPMSGRRAQAGVARRRASPPYLTTRILPRSMVTATAGDEQEAEDDLLGEDADAHEGHADAHHLR